MFGWAAGPPSLQGNASLSHQKIPFPTQSDGRKVKSPVMPRATKATEQGPVCWVGTAGGAGGLQRQKTQRGTSALHPGRHLQGADRSPPCNSQEMWFWGWDRAGRGNWGFISIYKTCFLSPAGYTRCSLHAFCAFS